jgi:serine protease inhibitor
VRISKFMLIGVLSLMAAAEPALVKAATASPTEATTPAADQSENRKLLADAQTKLAWELIEHLSKDGAADATVSPASLASAFAILSQGADPAMKTAIANTMGLGETDAVKTLAILAKARAALTADNGDLLQSADRIVFAVDSSPPHRLVRQLDKLGVTHSAEDLSRPEAVAKIDAWVNQVTQGAIPVILGEPLDKASFVVLNALRFKGQWKVPFDPHRTAPMQFQSIDGKNADVAMMHLPKSEHTYRTQENFVGIDLPFSNERFSLVIVTTTDKPARAEDFASVKDWLSGYGFSEHKGDLSLPRFKLSARSDLLPILDALGLDKARHAPKALAHFGQGTELSRVVQRTVFEVDETGAQASAATAIIGRRSVEDFLHMVVDKPFIFALRDHETGLILVAGYVGRPPTSQAERSMP